MRTWQVYGLVDPRTDSVRYVGLTVDPYLSRRLSSHMTDARGKGRADRPGRPIRNDPKNLWLRELLTLGLRPSIVCLQAEITSKAEADQIEMEWIQRLPDLTNELDGIKDRDVRARWWHALSPEEQQRINAKRYAGRHAPEIEAKAGPKISAANKGKIRSPEQRARISAGLKGKPKSAEHRAKLREATLRHYGSLRSP